MAVVSPKAGIAMSSGSQQVTWKALGRRGRMRRCDVCFREISVREIAEVRTDVASNRTVVLGECCRGKAGEA